MNHLEDQGLSLAEICDKLWVHKYLIVSITIAITLCLGIGSYFLMKNKQVTETGYEYNFIGVTDREFPDGTLFEFRDLVSINKLQQIKSSSSLFNEIDIEAMSLDHNTSITRQVKDNATANELALSHNRYTLSIPLQYFDYDRDVAESFIMSLIESIIDEAEIKNQDLAIFNYLDLIVANVEYLDMISYYNNQYNLLTSSMNGFIATYGDVTYDGTNITEMKETLTSLYSNGYSFSDLTTIIKDNNYYKNSTTYINRLDIRISTYEEAIYLNSLKITELETTYNNLVSTSNLEQANQILSDIVDYRIQNVDYQYQIDQYQEIIDAAALSGLITNANPEFLDILGDMETLINDYTTQYNNFYLSYINQDTRVIYDIGSIYQIQGGYGLTTTCLVSGFIGLFLSLLIVFIKESRNSKKLLTKS